MATKPIYMPKRYSDKPFPDPVKDFLKRNPEIKEALDIFNISEKKYSEAIKSSQEKKISISSESTAL